MATVFTVFVGVIVTTFKLALMISVLLASYAAALVFLGMCVLAFRIIAAAMKNFVLAAINKIKHGRNKVVQRVNSRKEYVKRYKEEKKKLTSLNGDSQPAGVF